MKNVSSLSTVCLLFFALLSSVAQTPTSAPIVDRYGQYLPATWPQKVTSDADILAAKQQEDRLMKTLWQPPRHRDPFGGATDLGWNSKATGFYRVEQHNGKWWFISPDGNPCFYTGVCTVPTLINGTPITGREALFQWLPPHEGTYAPAWGKSPWNSNDTTDYFSFDTANLIRKFGPSWPQQARQEAVERLQHWGFCGAGKWSERLPNTPSLPVLWYSADYIGRHPDVFNPNVRAQIRGSLEQQIAPQRNDPYILGWSIKNEFDEVITTQEIRELLLKGANVPAKRALVEEALTMRYHGDIARLASAWKVSAATRDQLYASQPNPPEDDLEALRQFFAKTYYAFLYKTVKQIDPHHLYFGYWIVPGWWQNASDWELIAPYCDVIGYDRYATTFSDSWLQGFFNSTRKPVLCGEFSFPPYYNGQRGFGRYFISTTSESQEGQLYTKWAEDAAANPYCIGMFWFEYRDEPITGRGPGHGPEKVYGENYAFGLVDVADRPRWELVTTMREVNLQVDKIRQQAHTSLAK